MPFHGYELEDKKKKLQSIGFICKPKLTIKK
jgi:hypothetical protein